MTLINPSSNHATPTAIADATSTSSYVAIPGLAFDLRHAKEAFFECDVTVHTVDIAWYSAGASDFSDEELYVADASNVAGPYTKSFVDPGMAYLRAKVKDTSGGSHGVLTLASAFAK